MKHTLIKTAILAAVLTLGACSSVPTTTPLLDQARGDFVAANNNSRVSTFAPLEFKQASEALDQANAAAARKDSLEQIDKLAYLAKQKIATAQEIAKQKQAEADIAASGKERDAVRLEARTVEADRAKMDAAAAKAAAAAASADAAAAQNQAAAAQGQVAAAEAQTREAQARAAQLEALMTDLQAKKTERGLIITIGDVLFGVDQANLTANGQATLRKLADALAQNPNRSVLVEGFTDSTGSTAHNQQLSEKRASSVRAALVEMGVARDRVAMRAYGEAFPVAPNDNAGNRQMNRRVEIVLSNEGAAIAPRR
ncbi:OmpA family protein [Massilia sp. CCM 8733]|uniref:OmpA family protein n=1 Tax=Massilia mucilaginosa TaxID=2609282 RepID=A0ABX0NYH3_9BURK|nr:OmpA family protein [Massilia mucilaginosa]NHZ91942.1 OmpA family protein [Massilia mucilaginosa]